MQQKKTHTITTTTTMMTKLEETFSATAAQLEGKSNDDSKIASKIFPTSFHRHEYDFCSLPWVAPVRSAIAKIDGTVVVTAVAQEKNSALKSSVSNTALPYNPCIADEIIAMFFLWIHGRDPSFGRVFSSKRGGSMESNNM